MYFFLWVSIYAIEYVNMHSHIHMHSVLSNDYSYVRFRFLGGSRDVEKNAFLPTAAWYVVAVCLKSNTGWTRKCRERKILIQQNGARIHIFTIYTVFN